MAESKAVVVAALVANGVIAVMKFVGFMLTGSASMLSETYHSISDTGNQVFLLIGLRYSKGESTNQHPFGRGKAQFFYSFLVAVLLFGIAGWESARHGWHAITHPEPRSPGTVSLLGVTFPGIWVNYGVLLGAIGFEAWAFRKAHAGLTREMREHGWDGLVETFRKTTNTVTLTAFTEDALAGGGAAIALAGIALSQVTGDPIYDAVAAFVIGLLLMGFAAVLAWENKRLLLGESFPAAEESELRAAIETHEDVTRVEGLRTVFFGPKTVLVTAQVAFADGLATDEIEAAIRRLDATLRETNGDVAAVYIEPSA